MTGYKYTISSAAKPKLCEGCPDQLRKCVTRGVWDPTSRLTILGESPSWVSINANGPFMGRNGLLLHKSVANTVYEHYDAEFVLKYNTAYCAGSSSDGAPKMAVTQHCKALWQSQLLNASANSANPHVILCLGFTAAKTAGAFGRKISEIRGKVFPAQVGAKQVKVIPTFSLNHIQAKPGLISILQTDIKKAIDLAYFDHDVQAKPIAELAKEYIFPKTIQEVRGVCDHILAYYDPNKQSDPWAWPIAIDTETNTLTPWRPDAKVLMVSMGWDDGKSTAIILDHPEAPYDPAEAWIEVKRVLTSPKPKSFHNAKFDLEFLECVYGIKVNNITWDTMLGEHWLDEDRKGTYGLKVLAPLYAPEYEGYEDTLHKTLRREDTTAVESDDDNEDKEGLDFWGEAIPEEQADPNTQWRLSVAPVGGSPELIDKYTDLQAKWFAADAEGRGKDRGVVLRAWKKTAQMLGVPIPTPVPTVCKAKVDRGFEDIPLHELLPYAAADTDVTRRIQKGQYRKIAFFGPVADAHGVMKDLYIPGSLALARMEFRGTRVDHRLLEEYTESLVKVIDEQTKTLHQLTLMEFNPQSRDALAEVMQACGFEILQTTAKTGKMSITKDILATYQAKYATAEGPQQDANGRLTDAGRLALVEALLLYTDSYNMLSRFIKNLRELSAIDGKIHTTFSLSGTTTGRLSSAKLNLQNIPLYMCKQTRELPDGKILVTFPGYNVKSTLIPDDPDEELFWELDIQAAEIRVLCYESGDQNLVDAVEAGADIHTVFLTKIRHPDLPPSLQHSEFAATYHKYYAAYKAGDEEISEERSTIKRIVFGTLYGSRAKGLAHQLGDDSPAGVAFAQKFIDALFNAFPSIKEYIIRTENEIRRYGYVRSVFGRYRRFPLAKLDKYTEAKAFREGVNFKIQSTSSDLVIALLSRVEPRLHEIGATAKLTVHDSIAGTIQKTRVHELKSFMDEHVVNETARLFPWMPVKWAYDLSIGRNYGEKIPYAKYIENCIAA